MNSEELYKIAADAVKRKRFKQALGFFDQILDKEPEFIEARKGIRAVLRSDGKATKLAFLSGLPLLVQIMICGATKKYEKGIPLCEKYLRLNYQSVWALKKEAEFALKLDYKKTAAFCYETLAELAPDDADTVTDAADLISDLGDFDKANNLMAQLAQKFPGDIDIAGDQSRIAAKKTLNAYETAETSRDVLKDQGETAELEKESQGIRTEDELQEAIDRATQRCEAEPDSARHRETLADLLARRKDFKEAVEVYKLAIERDPNNENTRSKLGDVRIRMLVVETERIKHRLAKSAGDKKAELQGRLAEANEKLLSFRLGEYERRLKINPNDLRARHDLGMLYFQTRELDQAIKQLQRSVSDAKYGFSSAYHLGLSFKAKKLFDLAIDQFNEAAKKPGIKPSERMEVHYESGICYLSQKKNDEALVIFKKILEKDYGYKDVAAQVEALQSKV